MLTDLTFTMLTHHCAFAGNKAKEFVCITVIGPKKNYRAMERKKTEKFYKKNKPHDKWKLPTPSFIATCNFSNMTSFELYSGNLR